MYFLSFNFILFSKNKKMTCGCKHKRGSGGTYLSGVTWGGYSKAKTGKGKMFSGGAFRKRRKKKRGRGMGMSGSGINFSGSGMVNDAMRVVLNRFRNGRRVI
jgi:hypothetical protein